MGKFEEILQDYINCKDINGLNFYAISYLDEFTNSEKIEEEFVKERILKQLENHTYEISDIYNLLSKGRITVSDIVKHTSIDEYDMLMDELKDFDRSGHKDNYKIKNIDIASDNRKEMESKGEKGQRSDELLYDLSKKIMDFLTDAKEVLVIKK